MVEQFEQAILIVGKAEEPAFLDRPFHRGALGGQLGPLCILAKLALVVIGFVANRIPAFVAIEIKVALRLHRAPDRLAGGMMIRLHRADEPIVGNIESVVHHSEISRHFVGKFARGAALFLGLARHFEAVFVSPGLEADVAPAQTLETCDDIGGDRLVGVADMGATIGVIDRRRDIEGFRHWRVR